MVSIFRAVSIVRAIVTVGLLATTACSDDKPSPGTAESTTQAPAPGSPGGTASKATAVDPCALFSAADAEALLGSPVDKPYRQEPVPGTIMACSYAEKTGPAVIQVSLRSARAWTIEQELAETEKLQGSKLVTQTMDVAGTKATWVEANGTLLAAHGGWNVTTSTSKKGDKLAISKALMEKVLPRLPPPSP